MGAQILSVRPMQIYEVTIMNNLELYEKVRAVPKEAQKTIAAGRLKGMTDINPMWRIKTLTEQFGICGFGWKTEIVNKWIEDGADGEKTANMQIRLFVKIGDKWSDGIEGVGGSLLVSNEKNGAHTDDECYKKAYTDAISVACKALGIGADVYFSKDSTKYDGCDCEPDQAQAVSKPLTRKEIESYGVKDVDGTVKWLEKKCGKPIGQFTEAETEKARNTLKIKQEERKRQAEVQRQFDEAEGDVPF